MEDGLADDFLDPLIVDRRLLLERIVGAAGLDSSEVGRRHFS
jgi:hypothetical protein